MKTIKKIRATSVVKMRRYPPNYDIYIGRPSKWGNPFVIGRDGTRIQVIGKYKDWFFEQLHWKQITYDDLLGLAGKVLGCFCKPLDCHGDVICCAVWIVRHKLRLPTREELDMNMKELAA